MSAVATPGPLAADLASGLDPVMFARRVGLEPDAWQARALRSVAPRVLMNTSRQSGKTTVAAVRAVHQALYEPRSLVLLLSPSQRQSQELFRKCLAVYRDAGRPVPPEVENVLSLVLENGSRIVSLPANEATTRGFSGVRLLIVDEASRVPDELYLAIRPMLAVSEGRLLALSTPFGRRGWWYEAWRSEERWERYQVPAVECPRISAEFLAEESRTLGEWWFAQEYRCEFLDAVSAAFRAEDIERAFDEEVEPWQL